jgi:DNA polymerase-3 subunit epsilon
MKLERPIVFYDLETTGVDTKTDRIVSMCFVKVLPDGKKETKTRLVNPTIPIPKGASEVHGITDEMVADAPRFRSIAKSLYEWLQGCDIAGYNNNRFDNHILYNEFHRCGILYPDEGVRSIDVFQIFGVMHPRTLSSVYKHYTQKELQNAHDAQADIEATVEIFEKQMQVHDAVFKDLTTEEVDKMCRKNPKAVDWDGKIILDEGEYYFNFGQYKGQRVREYLSYAKSMTQTTFLNIQTINVLREVIRKIKVEEAVKRPSDEFRDQH